MHFLGRLQENRCRKAAEHLRRKQLPGGGWAIYEGGPAEVSSSVKAYFVLKLMGDDPNAPHMVRARDTILTLGGIEACNSFTRIYLAIFGQSRWDDCPAVPPEIVLLPDWFFFNIYKMSSWSRGIVVPLSIIWASKPSCPVPGLRRDRRAPHHAAATPPHVARTPQGAALARLLHADRRMLKRLEAGGVTPLPARRRWRPARRWILERLDAFRRPGRDLPADHQHDHRVPLPGLRARRSAAPRPGPRAREARARGRGQAAHPALLLAGLGHGARDQRALATAARRPTIRRCSRPRAGCSTRRSEDRRLEARPAPRPSPAAGTSSTPTSAIPTPTTPPRSSRLSRARSSPARPTTSPARARSPAARRGCSRCRTGTAAGPRSTRTATTRS